MPSSLRILFAWSPAAIVLLGILLLSDNGEPGAPTPRVSCRWKKKCRAFPRRTKIACIGSR